MINGRKQYQVIIIGAGPGGAVLARELAGDGIKVNLYEQGGYEDLGHDWSDMVEHAALEAAGLPMPRLKGLEWQGELVKSDFGAPGLFEKHAVPRLMLCSPGLKSCKEISFRMIITDRRRLGQLLVDQAIEAGAVVNYKHEGKRLLFRETGGAGLAGVEVTGVVVIDRESGREIELEADLVVESSGFAAVLRTSLPSVTGLADPFPQGDYALVHREVRPYKGGDPGATEVPDYYRYGFHTGYQWSHIHNEKSIDVGSGVKNDPANPDPLDLINEFISRHPAIGRERLRGGRSLCLVGKPLTSFVTGGFLAIGDAASTSVPTTGCGAGSAIMVALQAAEVIRGAAREQRSDIEKLWPINVNFYRISRRGASFAALAAIRTALQSLNHDEIDFLFKKDLLDIQTLENAVNGIFEPPGLRKTVKALAGGIGNIGLLLKLHKAVSSATRIYNHCLLYPEKWDPESYQRWKAKATSLAGVLTPTPGAD